ncbi:MAG: helix-turn-helix transcriptional regulator [Clostridia bacterium]|nr:helix-turn-helix transcriptional regulator [Clostridia bacterium]
MKLIHKPYKRLKGWLRENGLTYRDVAKTLKITPPTVSAKINGRSDFLLAEIQTLKEVYGLKEEIFCTTTVA